MKLSPKSQTALDGVVSKDPITAITKALATIEKMLAYIDEHQPVLA